MASPMYLATRHAHPGRDMRETVRECYQRPCDWLQPVLSAPAASRGDCAGVAASMAAGQADSATGTSRPCDVTQSSMSPTRASRMVRFAETSTVGLPRSARFASSTSCHGSTATAHHTKRRHHGRSEDSKAKLLIVKLEVRQSTQCTRRTSALVAAKANLP